MDVRSWQWTTVLLIVVAYWVVLVSAWLFHVTRPSTRARARIRDFEGMHGDPGAGPMKVMYSHTVRLDRVALALFGPPVFVVLAWLASRIIGA